MRQKILLSAALLHNPDVLILDEPFSGLDVTSALMLCSLLRGLAAQGKMILQFACAATAGNWTIAAIGSESPFLAKLRRPVNAPRQIGISIWPAMGDFAAPFAPVPNRRYNKGMEVSEQVRNEDDPTEAGLPPYDILSDEFAEAAISAFLSARARALAAGLPVVYRDPSGFPIQEWPDGRRFEIRFRPGAPRDEHIEIVRELPARAA